jgi:predicted O-methyltransferase YrrM
MTDFDQLRAAAIAAGFDASLEDDVGSLLTVLAAAKPAGRILELGTGAGMGTAYLLGGATQGTRLVTVELEQSLSELAQQHISDDRVEWVVADAGEWLDRQAPGPRFDLIFADTWPGKFTHLDSAIDLLAPGGFYVIDDLQPQMNWPPHHQRSVNELVRVLDAHPRLHTARLNCASGVMICTNKSM